MHKLFFLTNHDENTWNATIQERYAENWKGIAALVYTLPQSLPLMYTGEEAGLARRLKFFEKTLLNIPNGMILQGIHSIEV